MSQTKIKVHLAPKPGVPAPPTDVFYDTNNVTQARTMAEAQYGSKYRVMGAAIVNKNW